MTFSSPAVKKAIKVAQDMGLAVSGFEVLPDGSVWVMTAPLTNSSADTALDQWLRTSRG